MTGARLPDEVEVWFVNGPADGAVHMLPAGPGVRPPQSVMLRGGEVFVGSGDQPAAAEVLVYELEAQPPNAEPRWVYLHAGTL